MWSWKQIGEVDAWKKKWNSKLLKNGRYFKKERLKVKKEKNKDKTTKTKSFLKLKKKEEKDFEEIRRWMIWE